MSEDVVRPIRLIRRLTIIGVGLIGGSLARALRVAGACEEVVGCGRSAEHLGRAQELGVVDRFDTDVASAAAGADMIVVCVPLGAMEAIFRSMQGHLAEDAVVTDAGSAKGSVVTAARSAFGAVPPFLVPGHPIAGTEKSGVEASFAELYRHRRVILTPLPETDARALARVRWMWEQAGAEVVDMGVEHHDRVLAATSHLPHMLAYTLVDTLAQMNEHEEIFRFAAGGFRDFTRIASSDPGMWHDICAGNREALLASMDWFVRDLQRLANAIRAGDSEALLRTFRRAKNARDQFTIQ